MKRASKGKTEGVPGHPMEKTHFHTHTNAGRWVLIALLTVFAFGLTFYFHAVLGIGTIVSHFYYIPILLSCLWWQRKGIWIAAFLVTYLLTSHHLLIPHATDISVYIRAFMLMVIAVVVAGLSERISATENQLRSAHDELEKRVVERTAQLAEANRELELEIEQHKRTEERLELSARRLEQRNEEVKNFAYIVSHDLRAPLINLKGFSAELRQAIDVIQPVLEAHSRQADDPSQSALTHASQDITEALGFITSSTNRMDNLINALLQLSRLGRAELKPERIDMNKKVQETLNTLAHQITEKRIQVKVDPLPVIEADRLAMQQILGNLLQNAMSYTFPGREGKIEIMSEEGLDQVTIHVKDNGRGIAPEDMDKVFMPFRRAGEADIPGEGMGMAYTQALVNRHGGHIQCRSKVGEGTTFSFTIPVPISTHEAS
jgi:signal transduction histidine kinase